MTGAMAAQAAENAASEPWLREALEDAQDDDVTYGGVVELRGPHPDLPWYGWRLTVKRWAVRTGQRDRAMEVTVFLDPSGRAAVVSREVRPDADRSAAPASIPGNPTPGGQ